MKFLYGAFFILIASASVAQAAPYQPIRDCNAHPQECAGRTDLINGNLRNMGQPGMTARIPELGIFQELCTSLGVSCGGSYDTNSMRARIRGLQFLKEMREDMKRNEAANIAKMNEARRRANELAAAAAAKKAAEAQSQESHSGESFNSVSTLGCNWKSEGLCRKFGCKWSGRRCVEAE